MKSSKLSAFITALVMVLNVVVGVFSPIAFAAGNEVDVTVHYYRLDGNYEGWNVWTWIPELAGSQQLFKEEDSFGKIAKYKIKNTTNDKQVGIIIRKGEWETRDGDIDRLVDIKDGKVEVWIVQGEPDTFDSEQAAKDALVPKLKGATMMTLHQVQLKTNLKMTLTGKDLEGIELKQGNKIIELESIVNSNEKSTEELGYEILGDKIHFVLVPGKKDVPKLDPAGKSTVFIAGTVNGWNGEGAEGWGLTWNAEKKYYELTKDFGKDIEFGAKFKFINVVDGKTEWMNGSDITIEDQKQTTVVLINTKEVLNIDKIYTVTKKDFKGESTVILGDELLTSKEFEDMYVYNGKDLGAVYAKDKTTFKLWAPFAEKVVLMTYTDGDIESKVAGIPHTMKKEEKGIWSITLSGDQKGIFYTYKVTNAGVER